MSKQVIRLYALAVSLLAFGGALTLVAASPGTGAAEPLQPAGQVEGPVVQLVDLAPVTRTRSS